MTSEKQFTITRKVAKHGNQAIIFIPRVLEKRFCMGTLAQITINVLGENRI